MSEKNIINIKSVGLFTEGIIDYAGLFPPAELDLKTAFSNYMEYLSGDNSYILSGFICPVKLLPELEVICNEISEFKFPVKISLILSGGKDEITFKENLISDLKVRENFLTGINSFIRADNFEYKIPESFMTEENNERLLDLFGFISQNLKNGSDSKFTFFAETSLTGDWKKNIKTAADLIEEHNETFQDTGFKLRTGGVTAAAIPTAEQIAFAVRHCLNRNLEMKFTAGLHHPFRHFDKNVNAKMHGFINIFSAGIIAKRHNISDHEMIKLLEDENPDNFKFTESGFSWGGYEIENEDIHFARQTFVKSYGSCSFDEPVDDLKKLNLII
ncbi:MAG: hypothetical protein IPM38_11045 [Ignavibacteria bacterium]|nr:hypothetical protein [Ignavibacteria bacterium]